MGVVVTVSRVEETRWVMAATDSGWAAAVTQTCLLAVVRLSVGQPMGRTLGNLALVVENWTVLVMDSSAAAAVPVVAASKSAPAIVRCLADLVVAAVVAAPSCRRKSMSGQDNGLFEMGTLT